MITDIELEQKVYDALESDSSVDATHIAVSAKGGIVTLTGYVASYYQKKKAETLIKRIDHVTAIIDELDLRMSDQANHNDLQMAESAVAALHRNAIIPCERIKVTVDNRHIVLEGEVDWHYQRSAAEDAIRPMLGLRSITNKIHVAQAGMRVHIANVKARIEQALVRNAHIDSNNINVEMHGSTLVLSGRVHSWIDKEEAGVAAHAIPGILEVRNNIQVEASP